MWKFLEFELLLQIRVQDIFILHHIPGVRLGVSCQVIDRRSFAQDWRVTGTEPQERCGYGAHEFQGTISMVIVSISLTESDVAYLIVPAPGWKWKCSMIFHTRGSIYKEGSLWMPGAIQVKDTETF